MTTSIRRPLVKMASTESAQANSHAVVTVKDDHLSTATTDYFFCLPNKKKACLKQPLENFIQLRNGKQT